MGVGSVACRDLNHGIHFGEVQQVEMIESLTDTKDTCCVANNILDLFFRTRGWWYLVRYRQIVVKTV